MKLPSATQRANAYKLFAGCQGPGGAIPALVMGQTQTYEPHLSSTLWKADAGHGLYLTRAGFGHALAWGSGMVGQAAGQT